MKNFKDSHADLEFDEFFAFPKLFPAHGSNDVISPDSNEAVKDQLLLFRISALLQARDYSSLENVEFYKYREFIYSYVMAMTMLEDQDYFEFRSFISQIGKLMSLCNSMDEQFYNQHMDKLIKAANREDIKLIDLFADISNGTSKLHRSKFSTQQLKHIDDFLYFVAKYSERSN
jgi:hypothetical protein